MRFFRARAVLPYVSLITLGPLLQNSAVKNISCPIQVVCYLWREIYSKFCHGLQLSSLRSNAFQSLGPNLTSLEVSCGGVTKGRDMVHPRLTAVFPWHDWLGEGDIPLPQISITLSTLTKSKGCSTDLKNVSRENQPWGMTDGVRGQLRTKWRFADLWHLALSGFIIVSNANKVNKST